MTTTDDRAVAACEEVLAVERGDPGSGIVRVVTMADAYHVDVRERRCTCPDHNYNLEGEGRCKHLMAAMDATGRIDVGVHDLVEDLEHREPVVATDGGADQWTVVDTERNNERTFDSRAAAEEAMQELEGLGADVELVAPGTPDGGRQPTDAVEVDPEAETVQPVEESTSHDLGERSVAEDPLDWVPGEFVDEIDGTQAINRKGFEVLAHFYDVDVETDLDVAPEETDFDFCRCKAVATTPDGRRCEAFGSAHVDRGDDPWLLLEMADTRARKRALSIATGVGAVAVEELRNEMQQ